MNTTIPTEKTYNTHMVMKILKICTLVIGAVILGACSLREPSVIKHTWEKGYKSVLLYKYAYIRPTGSLTSGLGTVYNSGNNIYGSATIRSVNPSEIIAGNLMQKGFIILPVIDPDLLDDTVIVSYGETGRRMVGFGYAIEVTIQFISAETNGKVCTCKAEGKGLTEADDIRKAINRALSAIR